MSNGSARIILNLINEHGIDYVLEQCVAYCQQQRERAGRSNANEYHLASARYHTVIQKDLEQVLKKYYFAAEVSS